MRFTDEEIKQMVLKVIKDKNLIFIDEALAFVPCSKRTFYKKGLHLDDDIREAIFSRRVNIKVRQRQKWEDSESAPLQLALYRLCATKEELERLMGRGTNETTESKFSSMTDDEIDNEINRLNGI